MGQLWDAMMSTGPHDRVAGNIERSAQATEQMNYQMSMLLDINVRQLAVQKAQLTVQAEQLFVHQEQLAVQQQQLYVQDQIRSLNQQQLAVSQEQLVQAMKTVQRLDITNQRLAGIDASLADISGLLVQQNALIQKSLHRLATEAQELIERGMEAYSNGWYDDAARDFEAALQKDPYSAIAHYFLGKCYFEQKRPLDAQQAYQKCIYFARKNAPIFHCLGLCDLADHALKDKKPADARPLLAKALACPEQDKTVLVSALLETDLAEGTLRPETCQAILAAFSEESVDPEVLLEVLSLKANRSANKGLDGRLTEEKKKWQASAQKALHERLISHFYRELDDYVYLAPRIRRGFMEAADGRFLSLGDPLADLLDWTAMIGERLLKEIDIFPPEYPAILRFYRPLQAWNGMLVHLNKLTTLLAAKNALVSGQFVEKLNLGLVDLPRMYEDDRILYEMNTEEGDTLALSCYYAIFTRNGVQHFPVPLQDFAILKVETYQAKAGAKGVLVVDPRHGQTLIQGTTGTFLFEASDELHYYIDHFVEAASLLSRIHECIQWAIAHEEELFSVFLLLHAVAEKLTARRQALAAPPKKALPPAKPVAQKTDEEFEVVEEGHPAHATAADDDFEVVEDAPPDKWYIARNKKKHGPITWKEVQNLAATGKLQPTDMLLQEGSQKWTQASSVAGLFKAEANPT